MARNLSWIDPEKLASLLDVVSPEPRVEQRPAVEDPSEATIDSALFAAAYTSSPAREAPAARPTRPAPAARPAVTAPAPPTPPRRAVAPAPAPVAAVTVAASTPPAAVAPAPKPPAIAAFEPDLQTDLAVRLEAFLDWVVSATRSRGALITDANGLVVVERRASDIEACMTASVDIMLNHVADVVQHDHDGYVALNRDGFHLVTLWTPSEYGRFFGVLVGETAPPQESIALAGQGLRTLFAN